MTGVGKLYNINGELIYEGEFLNSMPHGFGLSYVNNEVSYVGKWNQNFYHGNGLLIENNTKKYGFFQEGVLIEQINKIPKKFIKYLNKKELYDLDINLTKYKQSIILSPIRMNLPEPSAPPLIIEGQTVKSSITNNFKSNVATKTVFNPMNISYRS